MTEQDQGGGTNGAGRNDKLLFWGCFVALVATAFGFQVRMFLVGTWQIEFGLSETAKGEIIGAGLWPFAVSIILFSLVVDKIGYGRAMVIAFICHVAQAVILMQADGYNSLYWGSIIGALGNGTVEAVINPVVATMFPRHKTKWLAILHAGWPGGLVIAGVLQIFLGQEDEVTKAITNWPQLVMLIFLPVVIYALMLIGRRFPVQERVQAGVSYREMLQEPGVISWAVAVILVVMELSRETVFDLSRTWQIVVAAALIVPYAAYVRAVGRPMFFLLVLIMMPLATTELGIDGWSRELMEAEITEIDAAWVLVYTALIMMILRFFSGPIVHRLPPLNLLAVSAAVAAVGVYSLGLVSGGWLIFIAATVYGLGKTFFWPAMLGTVSEQFPRGGALTLNMVAGVGMLTVGTLGSAWLGFVQDSRIDRNLEESNPGVYEKVMADESGKFAGIFEYNSVDETKVSDAERPVVEKAQAEAKKGALRTAAILPCIMLVAYLCLIFYFKGRGGYKAVELSNSGGGGGGGQET